MADADSEVNVLRDQIKLLRAQLDASQTRCLELEQLLKESEPIPDDTQLSQSVTCTTLVDDVEIELPKRTDSVASEIPEECIELTEDKRNDVLGATDETDSVPQQEQVDDIQDPSTNLDASPPAAPSESSPLNNTNSSVPLHNELDEQAGITSDQNDEANSPALLLEFTEDSPYFQEEITESTERMQLLAKTLKSVSAAAREWETASIALAFAESRLGNAFRAVHHVAPGTVVSRSAELLGSAFHEVSQAREVNVDAFSGSFTNRVESFTKQEVQVCAEFHKKFLKVKSNYNHALVQKVATGTKLTNKLASATAKSVPEAKVALENIRQQVLDVDSQVKISHLEYELARYDLVVRLNRVAIKMDFELAEGLIAGAYSLLGFFHRCDDELSVTKECLSEFEGMLQPGRDAFLESVGTANRTREQLIELGNKLTSSLRDFSGQKTGEVGNQVRKLYSILEDEEQLASFSTWMLNHKGAHLPVVCVIECLALLENALHRSVSQPNIVGDQLPAVLSEDSKLAMHNLIRAITEACADDCPPPELSLQAGAGDSIAFHFWHEFANVMSTTRVSNFLDKELREMVGKVEVFFALLVPQFEVWLAGTNGAGCNENVTSIPVNTDDSNVLGLLEQVYAPRNKLNPRARSMALQSNGKLMRRRISFENPSSTTNKPNNEDVIPATTQHTPIKHSIRSRLKLWAQGTKSKLSQSEPPKIVSTQQDKEEDNNDSRRDSDGLQIMNTAELLMREPSEIVHQGYLFKLSTGIKKDWKRRWFILYPDVLLYIRDSSQFSQPVPVCNCMVLTVRDGLMEQSASSGTSFEPEACGVFAFEVLSPYSPRAYLLAAETSSEKQAWMEALRDCTAQMLNDFSRSQTTSSTGDQGSSQNDQQGNPVVSTSATPATVATSRQSSVTTDGANGTVIKQDGCCADCGSSDGSWASINLGIRLCIECSGVHRSLGVHVSKVRSVELDRWTGVQKDLLCALGNELANSVWEEDLDCQEGWSKPRPTDPREVKERFILAKYKWHGFIRSGQGQVVESELKAMYSHPKHKVTEFGEGSHPEDDAGHCGCELTLERLLFHGASENNLPLVYFCVVHKAKVTWQHPDTAETAVHVAARYGYALCCEYLCLNGGGACLQMRDCSDARPIDVAVLSNHAEVADILMDR